MVRTTLRRAALVVAGALLVMTATNPLRPADASATGGIATSGIAGTGSIIYGYKNDLWLTTPDKARTQRVTWDGTTQTADHSGGIGYFAPSQTDSGLIVAVRNQQGAGGYPTGWLWVMNRQGGVIRKFAPLQHTISSGSVNCSPVPYQYQPDGIVNAVVSPDGTKIAYVERGSWQDPSCHLDTIWSTFVVDINGTNAQQVRQSDTNPWNLEAGSWASSTRLVLARTVAGDEQLMYADAPTFTALTWWSNPDSSDWDSANATPSLRHGVISTVGLSSGTGTSVLRLWTTSGPPSAVTPRCEYTATGGGTDATAGSPTTSPDGTGVAWFEQGSSTIEVAGEGVYVMRTGNPATSCPPDGSKILLVQGGYMPFWGPAGVDVSVPTVTARSPASGATGVALGTTTARTPMTATFSEAVTGVSTASFTLKQGTTAIAAAVAYNATTRVATLTPNAPLVSDKTYTLALTSTIKSASGGALTAQTWNFITGPRPTATATSPISGGTAVPIGNTTTRTPLTTTFSEAVTGLPTTASATANYALKQGTTAVASKVVYNATTRVATLTPDAPLVADKTYTLSLTSAIKDLAGNTLTPKTWNFITGPRPTVTTKTPASGATAVSRTADITATFSEAVTGIPTTAAPTSTFTIKQTSTGTAVASVASYNTTNRVATLNPTGTLLANTQYTVTLSSGVKDTAGNTLTALTWSFTTGAV